MLSFFTSVAISFFGLPSPPPVIQPTGLNDILNSVAIESPKNPLPPPIAIDTKEKRFSCKNCSQNEQKAVIFLQDNGITDKNAIATILGNIRQESTFIPNICEGGARTTYYGCGSGGYGLIQWTDSSRYNGLGSHARLIGGDPTSIDTQLSYLVSESDWKIIERQMKTPGKSIDQYMYYASRWIRWGHHGARTSYAYDYAKKLVLS